MAKKKKKPTPAERHRQLQDQVQALPYAVAQLQSEGKRGKAFLVKYFAGPLLKVMKRLLDAQRYRGTEGGKLKQSEQMQRHLEQRRKAMEYMQGELQKQHKRAQKRNRQ